MMTHLKLNTFFYSRSAVEETARAFEHIAQTNIATNDQYHIVTITGKPHINQDILPKEFANYCLIMSKKEIHPSAFRKMR